MQKRFNEFYKHTLKWEGGEKLHNVSGDNGGWTKYGIAYNFNSHHFESFDQFTGMTYETAAEIAFENYAKPISLELVSPDAQAMFFDMTFNMGVKAAIKCVQRALKLTDDGILGKITKAALKELKKDDLYNERVKYYQAIVKHKPSQKKFYRGWINRANYFNNTKI